MLQAYRPSNRVPASGLFVLLLTIIGGGLILGGLAFALSRLVWLIIVFPIALGVLSGVIVAAAITSRRIRNPLLGIAAGLLIGVVCYGTIKYGGYLAFQSQARQMVDQAQGSLTASAHDKLIDLLLETETGSTGFLGYLKLTAQEGISIGRVGSSRKATLPESVTWIYWLIELGIISGIAAVVARAAARKPFCEGCQQWYGGGTRLGSAAEATRAQLLGAARSGDFRQVGLLLSKQSVGSPSLEIYLERCQHADEHPSVFTIRHASLNSKGKLQFKDLLSIMIAPHDVAELQREQAEQAGAAAREPIESDLVAV